MRLVDSAELAPEVQIAQGHLYLPSDPRLLETLALAEPTQDRMQEVAQDALAIMGLDQHLMPGEVIMKPHHSVVERDPIAPEQFFHADHSDPNRAAILFVGYEGSDPSKVPATDVIQNAALLERMAAVVDGGPLQDRLQDILVVRPYLAPELDNETRIRMKREEAEQASEWMNYPRHVLARLAEPRFRDLLTSEQRDSLAERTQGSIDTSRYTGDIFLGKLIGQSVLDEQPIPTCGAGSREIRLALPDGQTAEETEALAKLHDQITGYVISDEVIFEAEQVVKGSAMLVGKDQLHRSTPYRRGEHFRSIAAIKCYAVPGRTVPPSWRHAQGTDY